MSENMEISGPQERKDNLSEHVFERSDGRLDILVQDMSILLELAQFASRISGKWEISVPRADLSNEFAFSWCISTKVMPSYLPSLRHQVIYGQVFHEREK